MSGLIPLFLDIFRVFHRLGRIGGVIALALSAPLFTFGAWLFWRMAPWNGLPMWSPAAMVMGGVLALVGVVGIVQSLTVIVRGVAPKRQLPGREEFLAAVRGSEKPVWLCVDCRLLLGPTGACPGCGAQSTVVEVRDERDYRLVEAAIPER